MNEIENDCQLFKILFQKDHVALPNGLSQIILTFNFNNITQMVIPLTNNYQRNSTSKGKHTITLVFNCLHFKIFITIHWHDQILI